MSESTLQELLTVLERSKNADMIVSFDPNYRPSRWPNEESYRETVNRVLEYVDVIKASEEETEALTGSKDIEEAAGRLLERGISLVFVSKGAGGAELHAPKFSVAAPGIKVAVADTIGAGDVFVAAALAWFARNEVKRSMLGNLGEGRAREALAAANKAAALSVTRVGAMSVWDIWDDLTGV